MTKLNTLGVDLAKNVIQSSVVSASGKELQNKEFTRLKFAQFIAKQHGHQVKIIPAKAVAPFRHGR